MPVIVLATGIEPGREASHSTRAFYNLKFAGYAAIARRSSHGEVRTVVGAGHVIQFEKPRTIIDAIDEVVSVVRAAKQ